MKKLLLKTMLLLLALVAGMGSAWADDYNSLFTINSGDVVSGSSYQAHSATVSERGYIITFGGNNNSIGTNSSKRSNCNLSSYSKYVISPVTTLSTASAFACTTSISNVSKISYTFGGGSNQTNTNVYLLYSSDNTSFSQLSLTSGTQGASIASGTAYTFDAKTGYFALLFVATNSSGNWRIDNVNVTFYESASQDLATFAFATPSPSVTLSKSGTTFDANYSQTVTVAPATYDGTVTYAFDEENSTFDLNDADIDDETGDVIISSVANIASAETIVVKASATATAKYNKPDDAIYTLTVNPAPDGVGTPTFSQVTGSYYYGTTFTISSANASEIYYTTDETTPSKSNGTVYSGAIAINSTVTVKAIGYDGETASEVASIDYTLKEPEVPSFSVAAGGVEEGTDVELTMGEGGSKVVYTVDGTDPSASSTTYSSAITVNYPITIKAATVDGGNNLSTIETRTYTIVVKKTVKLWDEDFSSYSDGDVPSGGVNSYSCNGSSTKIYDATLAGGTSPEILVGKSGGYFQATIPIDNVSGNLTLTYKTNNTNLKVSSTTTGVSLTGDTTPKGATATSTVTVMGITPSMESLVIKFANSNSSNCRLDDILLTCSKQFETEPVSISGAQYATYASTNKLDFSDTDITVYMAKGASTYAHLTEVEDGIVPANKGVILFSETAKTYNVPITAATGSDYDDAENELVGVTTRTQVDATSGGKYNYILSNEDAGIGFYKATDGKSQALMQE